MDISGYRLNKEIKSFAVAHSDVLPRAPYANR